MRAAFTPGPWGCEQSEGDWLITYDIVLHHGPRAIAKVFDHACEFQEADARLISAAPELYEALEDCRAVLLPNFDRDLAKQVDAVLAKARGQ